MKQLLILGFSIIGLSGCVTSGSTQSVQMTQNTITNASLMSKSSSCPQISNSIQQMDQIILANSNAQTNAYNSNASLNGTKSTINQHLYKNNVLRENIGVASDIMKAVSGSATNTQNKQLQQQQFYDARTQKNRLVSVYQGKGC